MSKQWENNERSPIEGGGSYEQNVFVVGMSQGMIIFCYGGGGLGTEMQLKIGGGSGVPWPPSGSLGNARSEAALSEAALPEAPGF